MSKHLRPANRIPQSFSPCLLPRSLIFVFLVTKYVLLLQTKWVTGVFSPHKFCVSYFIGGCFVILAKCHVRRSQYFVHLNFNRQFSCMHFKFYKMKWNKKRGHRRTAERESDYFQSGRGTRLCRNLFSRKIQGKRGNTEMRNPSGCAVRWKKSVSFKRRLITAIVFYTGARAVVATRLHRRD